MGGFFLAFVAAPLAFLIFAAYTRVLLEVALVLFRIEENTRAPSAGTTRGAPPPPTAPPAPGVE